MAMTYGKSKNFVKELKASLRLELTTKFLHEFKRAIMRNLDNTIQIQAELHSLHTL